MKEPKHFKFVVSSAEEAVKVLREQLGENAKVVSVRQVEGEGLARFLRAPKLEVIARVADPEEEAEPEAAQPEPPKPKKPVVEAAPKPVQSAPAENDDPVGRILLKGGITETMLARLKSSQEWALFVRRPLRDALTEIAVMLRGEYQRNAKKPLERCVAFIGTAGSGKTTALCKRLAMEVFYKKRRAVVLKLDMDKANPGDGLAVFCDVLGVPMVRTPGAIPELAEDETLFVDLPGIAAGSRGDIAEMSHILAALPLSSRVLVVNAAYEVGLIRQAYRMGAALLGSHVVFTHLDELTQWGKLWEFVLTPELTPLFFSSGQNIAGDFTESIFDSVLDRSFPLVGKENAMERVAL